ncbi:hypothetical protein EMCRGX_G030429 [Ephydatia muelleri]
MSPNKHIGDFSTHFEEKVFSKTCKDSRGGSDTPDKYMTGNLLKTENGKNEDTQVQMKEVHVYNICQLVHKFAAFNAVKDGTVYKTGSLTSSGDGNSNEQVQGVRQQIDSHPPPLPPVEEDMHTKPSQHAHVHTDEAPVALSSSVPVFGIPEPLIPLLGQRAQEKPLLDDVVLSDDLPDPSKPDNTFTFNLHEVGPHPMPHPSQVNDVSNKKMELEKDAASCVNPVFMFYPFNAQMTDKRARRLSKVLPTGLIGKDQTCSDSPPPSSQTLGKETQDASDVTNEDVEMSPVVLMDQVPRPFDSDDKLLDQEAIFAGNVAVGGEQASMYEAMIEGVQGQGQMVDQCGDVTVVEAGTSPQHLGSSPSEGTVQVCCNNRPNKLDAMVVCRDLNLNYNSVVALCMAYFGPGPGSILLDHAIGVQNSLSSNDAGGKCGAVFVKTIRLTLGSGDRYYLGLKGRRVVEVHVCRGDQYVTICADTWSNIEASCQQPGYPPYVAITVVKGVLGGTTISISSISGFICNGAELSLSACPVVTGASVPCCLATSGQLRDVAKAGNCTHGDIRLVMSQINGPLKMCISIAWGTMCSEQVTSREVVSKQLNASKPNIRVNATGAVITGVVCGNRTGPIILDQPVCTKPVQQLLQGPSYTRDVTMVCNKPDMPSNLSHAQPLQQAPYGQDTNESLVLTSTSTGSVSELFPLQCSIVLTTCNHSHDAGVKCGALHMGTRSCTQSPTWVQSNLLDPSTVMITNANVAMVTSKPNSTLTSATSEDQADHNMQCGSDTPAKYKTGNLLKTGNGNHEEQQHAYGVRQQIDSHPPPLPPVEEEMCTKPSTHAHVHTDEERSEPMIRRNHMFTRTLLTCCLQLVCKRKELLSHHQGQKAWVHVIVVNSPGPVLEAREEKDNGKSREGPWEGSKGEIMKEQYTCRDEEREKEQQKREKNGESGNAETADASVVVLPSHDNTTFENNASYVTFTCFGIGAYMYLLWTVNGYDTGSPYVLNKGIRYTPYIISPDGLSVSSQLIVPTTKANNNITVICIVVDASFNPQFSNPVKLFLQGILPPPNDLKMNVSNYSLSLSWVAPDSLEVSTPPTISHYVLSNNLTKGTKTFNNPTTCNPLASCNYSFDLRDLFFTTDGNTTILDYNGVVEFTLFAVNGAGNGNAATCTLELQRRSPTDVAYHPNQTIPAAGNSTPASNNTTSAVHINDTGIVIAVCVGLVVIFLVVLITAAVCYLKKKKRTCSDIERSDTTDGRSSDCPSRAIGGNSSCTPEQSTAL